MQRTPRVVYLIEACRASFDAATSTLAKLMGEMPPRHSSTTTDDGASCRYFTVTDERAIEDHALIALIARRSSK